MGTLRDWYNQRDKVGRFKCDPPYPRKRDSKCGCTGGGDRPCVNKSAKSAKHVPDEDQIEALYDELQGVERGIESATTALETTTKELREIGATPGRKITSAKGKRLDPKRATSRHHDDSQESERELQEQYRHLKETVARLKSERRGLRISITRELGEG